MIIILIVNEISPVHLTGAFGSCHQLMITLAIVITYFIGFILPKSGQKIEVYQNNLTWKLGMAFPGFMSIIQILLMLTVYTLDSPSYYCGKDEEKAKFNNLAL